MICQSKAPSNRKTRAAVRASPSLSLHVNLDQKRGLSHGVPSGTEVWMCSKSVASFLVLENTSNFGYTEGSSMEKRVAETFFRGFSMRSHFLGVWRLSLHLSLCKMAGNTMDFVFAYTCAIAFVGLSLWARFYSDSSVAAWMLVPVATFAVRAVCVNSAFSFDGLVLTKRWLYSCLLEYVTHSCPILVAWYGLGLTVSMNPRRRKVRHRCN